MAFLEASLLKTVRMLHVCAATQPFILMMHDATLLSCSLLCMPIEEAATQHVCADLYHTQWSTFPYRHPQHSGLGSREQPLQLTQRAQELFLAYAHYCGERGVEPLIPIVRQAVSDAVSGIQLTAKLGADQVLQVFSDAHTSKSMLGVTCIASLWFSLLCLIALQC